MSNLIAELKKRIQLLSKKGQFLNNTFCVKNLPSEVLLALGLKGKINPAQFKHSNQPFELEINRSGQTSSDLFTDSNGQHLPCWIDSLNVKVEDDWLNSKEYYPLYFDLFSTLKGARSHTRLLEIGVRTGYMGVVFTKAINGNSYYYGIDPNFYVDNGLLLASESLRKIGKSYPDSNFHLHYGFSSSIDTQYSLKLNEKFDFIHIDGDHTFLGKIIDLWLCKDLIKEDGYVLVDDYEHASTISEAIEIAFHLGWYKEFAYLKTHRGMAILK